MAATYAISIDQGATYDQTFTWQDTLGVPINLTGYTAHMQIRPAAQDPILYVDLTTSNGGIVLGGSAGTIRVIITASATGAFDWTSGAYDLKLTSGSGAVTRLLEGTVTVDEGVTVN